MKSNYQIEINVNDSDSSVSAVANTDKAPSPKDQKNPFTKELAVMGVAYHTAKSFATQVIKYEVVDTVQIKTGSKEMEQRAQFAYSIGEKAFNLVESAAIGWVVTGNPLGALAGAALSGLHTAIGYIQAQNTINLNKAVEGVSLDMNLMRAGGGGSRRNE